MASAFLDRVSNKALGELLIEKGALSQQQIDEALDLSRQQGIRLGEALISLGYITRDALGYAIGEQYGLRPMELQPSMVDEELVRQFDFQLLSEHTMLPLIMLHNELVVVVSDPNDQEGLLKLAKLWPKHTITPQLGAADQIRRCLEEVRPNNTVSLPLTTEFTQPVARVIPRFTEIPDPQTAEFIEWLIGLAANNARRDVMFRDMNGQLQVSLTPASQGSSSSEAILEEVGSWPRVTVSQIRSNILQRALPLEHTRGQAAKWAYSISHRGNLYDFLILMPISQGDATVRIRALAHETDSSVSEELPSIPLSPNLEAGKYTVVLYDESVSLERSLAQFMEDNAENHSFLVFQQSTRCLFKRGISYPAPFANLVTAAQAAAATCVIIDHPVEYREAIRLLTSTYPPPAVLVCAPLPSREGGSGSLSPDVEELIKRQDAQSVRLMESQEPESHKISSRGID